MDVTTLRVREPRELLALLPYQLGFQPRRSVVAVALRPPRGRVGLVARVDLVDLADDDVGPQLARRLVTHLVGDGAARAVLVVYAEADPRALAEHAVGVRPSAGDRSAGAGPLAPPDVAEDPERVRAEVHAAVGHLRGAAAGFLGEVAVWVVAPGGYLALDCADPGCCPAGGRPLRELQSTQVGAHMVLAGAMVADSRDTLVPDVPAPAPARRNAVRAAGRWSARRAAAEAAGGDAVRTWRAAGLHTWRCAVRDAAAGEGVREPAVLGRLAAALDDVVVRDAVLLTLVPGAGDLPERSLRGPGDGGVRGVEVSGALAAIVGPGAGTPPQPEVRDSATLVLDHVVAHAAGARRAPALTLLGLLAWWQGDGARAGVLVERALRDDPDHRLAHLLADALAAGLAPGWVRAGR